MNHTILVAGVLITGSTYAQSGSRGIDVFGYLQARAPSFLNVDQPVSTRTFTLDQVNLFFNKNFNDEFSSLVHLQFVNSFSTVLVSRR
jgi:hypothetical protein